MNKNIIKVDSVILFGDVDYITLYLPNDLFDQNGDFIKSTPDDYAELGGLDERSRQQNIYKVGEIRLLPTGGDEEPFIEIPSGSSDSIEFVNSNVAIQSS